MNFLDANGLASEDRAEVNFLLADTDVAATSDHDGFVVEGIVDVGQSGVDALGRLVDLRRTFHVQSFVRALVVAQVDDARRVGMAWLCLIAASKRSQSTSHRINNIRSILSVVG